MGDQDFRSKIGTTFAFFLLVPLMNFNSLFFAVSQARITVNAASERRWHRKLRNADQDFCMQNTNGLHKKLSWSGLAGAK